MAYVGGEKRSGCVFCGALAAGDDRETLILHRGDRAFVMLNLYPYNSGHSMVIPYEHVPTIEDLDAPARSELLELATLAVEASRRVLRCDGFNLGLNLGAIAGAGVADHLHLHVVPRWTGDANFMPILGDTMVMPELLPATYARLRGEIEAIVGDRKGSPVVAARAIIAIPGGGIALATNEGGDPVFPGARVEPGETTAEAALRAVRETLGIDAAIAGWAGIAVEPEGATIHFLTTAQPARAAAIGIPLVPVSSLEDAFASSPRRELLSESLPVLARLVGDS